LKKKLLLFDRQYPGMIAGVDEAGRGPWAGPVVAAAVILNPELAENLAGVDDSKKLTEKMREELFDSIIDSSVTYAITEISHIVIDRVNILNATMAAMKGSIEKLSRHPEMILIDGNRVPDAPGFKMEAVIDGDAKSLSIAAASILAKVYRDRIMRNFDRIYPGYGFASHKGYGTKEHMAALAKKGVCDIHRKSYKPVMAVISGKPRVKPEIKRLSGI
jgi:ribonuclease HII